ncbi:MAG: NAD(P)/FAD-dependent oxidoreductase [Roseiflexaceae bacterium]
MATKHSVSPPGDPHESRSYWQATTAPLAPDPPELPTTADIAVIGGGLLGISTAYWLARAGASVALIEAGALAAGATGRNGGFMVAGTADPYPQAIARHGHATAHAVWSFTLESRALLRQTLAEEAIDCDYREPGLLHLALGAEQQARLAQTVAALRADAFAAELLDRDQAQELVGTPLGPQISGGLFAPENGLLHPARLVLGLATAARWRGARIYEGAPALQIETSGAGVRVRTTRGDLRASAAVVAVNAWSDRLIPVLAGAITPVRGQVLAYAPLPPMFRCGMSAAVTPTGEYWQQALDGTLILGGCRAAAPGADVGISAAEPTPVVQAALEQVLPRLFPALRGAHSEVALQVARRWAGLMAFTADGLPIADRAPGLPGVWVVGGFCGHGMPFGLRLGQLLAEAATSGAAPAPLAPFRLDRPTLKG